MSDINGFNARLAEEYTNYHRNVWGVLFNYLSSIPGFTINNEMMNEYIAQQGGRFPQVLNYPTALHNVVSYKNVPLIVSLSATMGYSYIEIHLPEVDQITVREAHVRYHWDHAAARHINYKVCDDDEETIRVSLVSIEQTGTKPTDTQIIDSFVETYSRCKKFKFTWRASRQSDKALADTMEAKYLEYQKELTKPNDSALIKQKILARYTKNRWPIVERLMAARQTVARAK